jgi:hypothetical protein
MKIWSTISEWTCQEFKFNKQKWLIFLFENKLNYKDKNVRFI